jgi:hypothetical protein
MKEHPTSSRARGLGLKIALVGGGLAAGVIVATALGANAATTSGSGSSATTTQPAGQPGGQPAGPPANRGAFDHGGSAPVRGDEKSLDSALTVKLKTAALKAVPGGTVYRIETDAGDGTYEAHMTKSDGSLVTVKFDKTGTVTGVEQGMGKGDPHP